MCDVRLRDIRDVWRARDLGFHSVIVGALPLTNPNLGALGPPPPATRSGAPTLTLALILVLVLALTLALTQAPAPAPISSRRDAAQDMCARRLGTFLAHQGEALLHPRTICRVTLTMLHPLLTPLSLIMLHPLTMRPPPPTTTTTPMAYHNGLYPPCCTMQAMLAKGSVEFGGGAGKAVCSQVPLASGRPCGHPPLPKPARLLRKHASL